MSDTMMTEQEQRQPQPGEAEKIEQVTDRLSVILNLNSEDEWNNSARELMSRIRTAGKIHVEIESLVKQYFINIQSVVEAIHDINKKTPTFEIVDNIQDEGEKE